MYSVDLDKKYGFVYMIINKSFPNWVKIGRTNNVQRRIKEGNTFVPTPFILHRAWVTNEEVYAEKLCHQALSAMRSKSGTEYFSVQTSVSITQEICEDTGIEYELYDFPLDDLADYIENLFYQNGLPFEHAWHPDLEA